MVLPATANNRERRVWRMGWDSNPRGACAPAGFQDRCLKPLGHPSAIVLSALKLRRDRSPVAAILASSFRDRGMRCRAELPGEDRNVAGTISRRPLGPDPV